MNLRFYAAIMTGCLAEVTALAALWQWSSLDIFGVAFWAVAVYLISISVVLWVTEPKPEPPVRKNKGPQIYTLKKEDAA